MLFFVTLSKLYSNPNKLELFLVRQPSAKTPAAICHNFRNKCQNIKLSSLDVDDATITAGMEPLSGPDPIQG